MSTLKFNRWQNLDGVTHKTVLQVVSASTDTVFSTSSTSFVDTPLTLSITPTSATSKVLVLYTANILVSRSSTHNLVAMRIQRNGATIYAPYTQNTTGTYGTVGISVGAATSVTTYDLVPFVYLDFPASTSEVTYTLQGCVYQNLNSMLFRMNFAADSNSQTSTMTLMEIAQ